MVLSVSFFVVLVGVVLIVVSSLSKLRANQEGIDLFKLGWGFVLAGALLLP